jgi:SNF2 family DNA or RNA helicase
MHQLLPHQVEGVQWLRAAARSRFLWDDQGLGKTVQVLQALEADAPLLPHLVVCPVSVIHNWAREAAKWAPRLKVAVLPKRTSKVPEDADLVIVSYHAAVEAGMYLQLTGMRWGTLILDEAHYLKNPKAHRTKRILGEVSSRKPLNRQLYLARAAARVWCLTGTPMPNNPTELYAPLKSLAPEVLMRPGVREPMGFKAFRDEFCMTEYVPFGDGVKIVGARNAADLRARLAPASLRRKKDQVLDLPPIRWSQVSVTVDEWPDEMREIEDRIHATGARTPEEMMAALKNDEAYPTWRRLCGVAKARSVGSIVWDELKSGAYDKVVLIAHHLEVIDALKRQLLDFHPLVLTGELSAVKREAVVHAFQTSPKNRVFIGQIDAAGVGITLTAAHQLVFAEQSYVPGANAQAADRIYRIGQTKSVLIRVMSAAGSVDERVAEILSTKQEMIHQVIQ